MESWKKSSRVFTKGLVSPTICVKLTGTDEQLHLHRSRLEEKSVYFQRLLRVSSGWQANTDNRLTLELAPHACSAFHAFAEYMYTNEYSPCGDNDQEKSIEAATVYIMADRFQIDDLKPIALERLRGFFTMRAGPVTQELDLVPTWTKKKDKKKKKMYEPVIDSAEASVSEPPQTIMSDYILLMKEILYDGYIDEDGDEDDEVDDQAAAEAKVEGTGPVSDSLQTGTDAQGDPTSSPAEIRDLQLVGVSNPEPTRDAQLLFSRYLASHLPRLRQSEGFKRLLDSGELEGPFTRDLILSSPS